MRNSTIGKQLSFLKWFLCWSFKQGKHSNNAYDTFKPKLKDTQKNHLSNVGRIEQAPRVQNPTNEAGSRTCARCFSLSMLHRLALF